MDVRLARPTDAPIVLALTLDDGAHLVKSPDRLAARPALRSLVLALLPFSTGGRTWIARDDDAVALLVATPRRYVIGWDLALLAVRGDHRRVLAPAVDAVTRHLQSRGVPRLFARCREDAHQELQALGFRVLAREYLLAGTARGTGEADSLPVDSRYRMPQDAWPLHQLESQITPPLVRQLEGLTSRDWSQGARGLSEIVVERDGRTVAWIGWDPRKGKTTRQIDLLVEPEYRQLAPDLLEHVLGQANPGTRFIARVRDYHPETVSVFVDAGFSVVCEEVLMVRHGGVELARTELARMRVAPVPGIHAFPVQLGVRLRPDPRVKPTEEDRS